MNKWLTACAGHDTLEETAYCEGRAGESASWARWLPMFTRSLAFLAVLAGAGVLLGADDPDFLAQALALEKTMQKIIVQAEPAVACILVSRSDAYRELGQAPAADDHP